MSNVIAIPKEVGDYDVRIIIGGGLPSRWELWRFYVTNDGMTPRSEGRGDDARLVPLKSPLDVTELSWSIVAINDGELPVNVVLRCEVFAKGAKIGELEAPWKVTSPWRTCRFNASLRRAA